MTEGLFYSAEMNCEKLKMQITVPLKRILLFNSRLCLKFKLQIKPGFLCQIFYLIRACIIRKDRLF